MIKKTKILVLLLVCLLISSCAAHQLKKENERRAQAETLRPEWTRSVVGLNKNYYWGAAMVALSKEIGLNQVSKEHIKRSALNDISGQISVKIASQSVFSNTSVSEKAQTIITQQVQQTIRLSSQENLEGVERVEYYQDEFGYFELYRLSISNYWERRQHRIELARDESFELLDKAEESRRSDDYRSAILYSMKALQGVFGYAGDDLSGEWQGKSANPLLESERFLQETIGQMTLAPLSALVTARPGEVIDASRFGFKLLTKLGKPIAGIKLNLKTDGMMLPVASAFTDGEGRWSMVYRFAVKQSNQSSLTATVDLLPIVSAGGVRNEIGQIALSYPIAPARIVLQAQAPQMRLVTLGSDLNVAWVAKIVASEFGKKGVEVTTSKGTPLQVTVNGQMIRRANYLSSDYSVRLSWSTPDGAERNTLLSFTESAMTESELTDKFLLSFEKELRNRVVTQVMESMY